MSLPRGYGSAEECPPDDMENEEIIEESDRKELTSLIKSNMRTEQERSLCYEIIKNMTPKQVEDFIEDMLYDKNALRVAKDFIKDNCPEIAE